MLPAKGCTGRLEPLPDALEAAARVVLTTPGKIATITIFLGVLVLGVIGLTQLYVDWKLEWYFPDDSYVASFLEDNEKFFASGTSYNIHTANADIHDRRGQYQELAAYTNSLVFNRPGSVSFFWSEFVRETPSAMTMEREEFYSNLHQYFSRNTGCGMPGVMRWEAAECEICAEEGNPESRVCSAADLLKGVRHTRGSATFKLEFSNEGHRRYDTLTKTREGMARIFGSELEAFPFSSSFTSWEEVGIIEGELLRNLLFAGVVIVVVVFGVIQDVKVSLCTVVSTCLVIMETAGCLYFWDVTISGMFTIIMVVCVGLAVDYAAHIGHCFKHSYGTAEERAIQAIRTLGPSVFNAVISTLLAILVVGFSKSFVFELFFRILCVLCIVGGAHGLWLLPVVLSIVGGDNLRISKVEVAAP